MQPHGDGSDSLIGPFQRYRGLRCSESALHKRSQKAVVSRSLAVGTRNCLRWTNELASPPACTQVTNLRVASEQCPGGQSAARSVSVICRAWAKLCRWPCSPLSAAAHDPPSR